MRLRLGLLGLLLLLLFGLGRGRCLDGTGRGHVKGNGPDALVLCRQRIVRGLRAAVARGDRAHLLLLLLLLRGGGHLVGVLMESLPLIVCQIPKCVSSIPVESEVVHG